MSPLNWKWLQRLLGVAGDDIPDDARLQFVWTNLPQSWRVFAVLFGVAAAIYLSVRLYRSDAAKLSPRARRVLAGLRVAVVLLLAVVALGPALSYTRSQVLQPVVVVLRDASQSMAVADRHYYAEDRFALAKLVGRSESSLAAQPVSRARRLVSIRRRTMAATPFSSAPAARSRSATTRR